MPVAYVDVPTGLSEAAKKKVFTEVHHAVHDAWPIPDTRVLIREWPNLAVSLDGRIENVPMRPIVTLAVPPGLPLPEKRKVIKRLSDTLGEVCHREVEEIRLPSGKSFRTNWVLTFFWELPLDQVGLGDILASENPMVTDNLPRQ
jgi:phenylpyruvate tautomerase PptA (4-oxalocrotonate tautomerase family)